MQISQMLRRSAERFNQAADAVCFEYAIAIRSSGICSPCDRSEFEKLVKIKMIALTCEERAIVHTNISEANTYVHQKLSA
jgi:hypothetical protein